MMPVVHVRCHPFGRGAEAGERAGGDTVDEHRSDDGCRRENADEGPAWAVPDVQQANVRALGYRLERPLDIHAGGDTPDVAKAHRGARVIHRHLGQPPGGPANDAKWSPRRHLDDAAAVGCAIAKSDPPIMPEIRGPALD